MQIAIDREQILAPQGQCHAPRKRERRGRGGLWGVGRVRSSVDASRRVNPRVACAATTPGLSAGSRAETISRSLSRRSIASCTACGTMMHGGGDTWRRRRSGLVCQERGALEPLQTLPTAEVAGISRKQTWLPMVSHNHRQPLQHPQPSPKHGKGSSSSHVLDKDVCKARLVQLRQRPRHLLSIPRVEYSRTMARAAAL